jgi:hypothetical protein
MKEFMLARLEEASTWRSMIWVLTSFGLVAFKGEQAEAIVALGMCLAGGVGITAPDKLFKRTDTKL